MEKGYEIWYMDCDDTGVSGGIILNWIFRGGMWGLWTGLMWFRIETSGWLL